MNNVFLSIGPDNFLLKEFISQYKKAAIVKYGEFSVQTLNITDHSIGEIINEVSSPAFFGGKRIIFLKQFPPPATPKLSEKKKEEYDSLLQRIKNLPEEVVLFLVISKPDKRTKFFKTIKKECAKIYDHASFDPKRDGRKFTQWICERATQYGSKISPAIADFLRSYVGNNLESLNSEIKKLCLLKIGKEIEKKDIIALCAPSEESADFAFSNAISSGNAEKICTEFHSLVSQFDAGMVWNRDLLSTIRTLLKIRFSLDSPQEKSGIHPFVARNMKKVVNNFSTEKLKTLQYILTEIDAGTKNGTFALSGDTRNFTLYVEKILWEMFQK